MTEYIAAVPVTLMISAEMGIEANATVTDEAMRGIDLNRLNIKASFKYYVKHLTEREVHLKNRLL